MLRTKNYITSYITIVKLLIQFWGKIYIMLRTPNIIYCGMSSRDKLEVCWSQELKQFQKSVTNEYDIKRWRNVPSDLSQKFTGKVGLTLSFLEYAFVSSILWIMLYWNQTRSFLFKVLKQILHILVQSFLFVSMFKISHCLFLRLSNS